MLGHNTRAISFLFVCLSMGWVWILFLFLFLFLKIISKSVHLLDVYMDSLWKPFNEVDAFKRILKIQKVNMKEILNFGCLLVDPMDRVTKKKKKHKQIVWE